MILVTGATGTIGSTVAALLSERGEQFRALARDPGRVRHGEAVRGDYADPDSLRAAVDGVDTLLLITAFSPNMAAEEIAMVDAARAAGVKKVVKLSSLGTGDSDDERDSRSRHAPAERAVRGSGMRATILRPSGFASNALMWREMIDAGTPIPDMTGGGRLAVVDPRDVAAVAVAALTSNDRDGATLTLTGPVALSIADQAAVLATELGRPVTAVDVPPAVAAEGMLASGMPAAMVETIQRGWELVRAGGGAAVTDDVEQVLGRPPRSFAAWVRDHRDAFGDGRATGLRSSE